MMSMGTCRIEGNGVAWANVESQLGNRPTGTNSPARNELVTMYNDRRPRVSTSQKPRMLTAYPHRKEMLTASTTLTRPSR